MFVVNAPYYAALPAYAAEMPTTSETSYPVVELCDTGASCHISGSAMLLQRYCMNFGLFSSLIITPTLVGRIGRNAVYRKRWQPIEHIPLITTLFCLYRISTHVLCKECRQHYFPFSLLTHFSATVSSFMWISFNSWLRCYRIF